jgi:ketosteroid isomerase-like protein
LRFGRVQELKQSRKPNQYVIFYLLDRACRRAYSWPQDDPTAEKQNSKAPVGIGSLMNRALFSGTATEGHMRKYILAIGLLTTLISAPVAAQTHKRAKLAAQKIERELIELERQLSEALARQDAPALDRLWSDSLVFTFPNGKVSNKAERLAAQKPATGPDQLISRNEAVKVYLYGNSAIVTVRSRWESKNSSQQVGDPYQATHVWVKQQGRWRLVAAHVSQVKS